MLRILNITAAVLIIGYLVWPYGTLLRFYLALKSGDEAAVTQLVHWPSIRHTLEKDINKSVGILLNRKLENSNEGAFAKLKMSFDSVSVASDIAAKLATAKSFIFLFNQPQKIHCLVSLATTDMASGNSAECALPKPDTVADNQDGFGFRGPNFARLFDKTNYLFFTDPTTFKFDVEHETIRLNLVFARHTFGWQLVSLNADWDRLMADLAPAR